MVTSKIVGWLVILYAVVFTLARDGIINLIIFIGPVLSIGLALLLNGLYLVGGVGLIYLRRWAIPVVLFTALAELLLIVATQLVMYGSSVAPEGDMTRYYLTQWLIGLVPPAILFILALRLWKQPG